MENYSFLKNSEIDKQKWDSLQKKYAKGLPYANSWYLDAVCDNWNLIIYKDYEAGFVFQINKKYGLSYSLHPFLIQQLGFFGEDESIFDNMISLVQKKVFHYHYHLNYFNSYAKNLSRIAKNHELLLDKTYEEAKLLYKTNTKRNLKKAYSNSLKVTIEQEFRQTDIAFVIENSKIDFTEERLKKFSNLMQAANENNALEIYRIEQDTNMLAMAIFIKNNIRAVYLLAVNTEKGKALKANFLLLDTFIRNNSESSLILDFEGSNIDGISRFYKGFAAVEEKYNVIKKTTFKNWFNKL